MTTMDDSKDLAAAVALAERWTAAWNRHDIEAILSNYTGDATQTSPLAVARLGRRDGAVRGIADLRDYFLMGLRAAPDLRFDLQEVLVGVGGIALRYRRESGLSVVEVIEPDEAGRIVRGNAYHGRRVE